MKRLRGSGVFNSLGEATAPTPPGLTGGSRKTNCGPGSPGQAGGRKGKVGGRWRCGPHFSASLIAADFTRLGEQIQAVVDAGAHSLHFDVMDHHYVPNLSIGAMVCESIHQQFPDLFIDVHLMVTDPDKYLEPFAKAGASQVSVHPETCPDTTTTLQTIESLDMRPGVVFNPDQAVELGEAWHPHLKHLLLMSVFPGFGGQQFIPESVAKIETTRQQLDQLGLDITLAVDGGISPQTVGDCYRAGANFFVVGSALLRSDNYAATVQTLKNNCN